MNRALLVEASVATVYRHVCSDALRAAEFHEWEEFARLLEMARQIGRTYPGAAHRARYAQAESEEINR